MYHMHELKKQKGIIPTIDAEVTDAISRKILDVAYCDSSDSQKLDIYYPEPSAVSNENERYPVIVYFHGGGFAIGAKNDEDLEPMLCALTRGYAVVSAEYRKSGEAVFPAALYDAKAVIRFLRANAEQYHLDTGKIGVWGPSSGGWMVSMLGVTGGNPGFEDLSMGNEGYSSEVQAVLDWCGPCGYFYEMDEQLEASGFVTRRRHDAPQSPESHFLGNPITEIRELCRLASPMTYVHPAVPVFQIVHGAADEAVPVQQSRQFAERITQIAGSEKVQLYIEEGQPHHGNPWYTEDRIIDMGLDFFDRVLRK